MTIVLTPYWSNGQQKLRAEPLPPAAPPAGFYPAAFDDAIHALRCLAQLRSKDKSIEKYIFLAQLKHADERMFYKLVLEHMGEITPLIYTPTVGDACLQHSQNFRRPEGLYVSIRDKGRIGQVLRNWPRIKAARIAVVTDGSRILGLGDLGVNGMPISIGKLSLYVSGAGLRPESTIPICLDLGTNSKYLDDPLYLGLRHKRVPRAQYDAFMEEFMQEMSKTFPKLLIQFEDFSTDSAFLYLQKFRNRYPVFNDDIQGTGAVVLSGFINAAKLSSAASGLPMTAHRILFLGSGSAGVGVGMQLMSFFLMQGLSEEEARNRIYYVDSRGLIFDARDPTLEEHKKYFSRKDYSGPPMTNLLDIIDYVKPTALMGLSTTKGAFTQDVVEYMAALNPRPIIFPLSNPVRLCELDFPDAVEWTSGRVLYASGSPYDDVVYNGKRFICRQGNNMYIFPGLGLGSILARASSVTDGMVEASSIGLADALSSDEYKADSIYPSLDRIREISAFIALRVIRQAQKERVDRSADLRTMSDSELLKFINDRMWKP